MDVGEIEEAVIKPKTDSDLREERKIARRMRIAKRLEVSQAKAARQNEEEEEGEQSEVVDEFSKTLREYMNQTTKILMKVVEEGEEHVTNVKAGNEAREMKRRIDNDKRKQQAIEEIEKESIRAHADFHKLVAKCKDVLQHNDPLFINEELNLQKEKCEEIIRRKDEVIAMLKEELMRKERFYFNESEKQSEDVDILSRRIEEQIKSIRKAYNEQLEKIENLLLDERNKRMREKQRVFDVLFKKRSDAQEDNMRLTMKLADDFYKIAADLEIKHSEEYRKTKIELENVCAVMSRQFEEVKVASLLAHEKLDYNFQVLNRKETENLKIKVQQKKRLARYKEMITKLQKQIKDLERDSALKMDKLQKEIDVLKRDITGIDSKANNFATNNDRKFWSIWSINEERARSLMNTILAIDKYIYEAILGKEWVAPFDYTITKDEFMDFNCSLGRSFDQGNTSQIILSEVNRLKEAAKNLYSLGKITTTITYKKTVEKILTMIYKKCGFLSDHFLDSLNISKDPIEKRLIRLDYAFKALNITHMSDINLLVEFFLPYTTCRLCDVEDHQDKQKDELSIRDNDSLSAMLRMGMETNNLITSMSLTPARETIRDSVERLLPGSYFEEPVEVSTKPAHMCQSLHIDSDEFMERRKFSDATRQISDVERGPSFLCRLKHPLEINPLFVSEILKQFVESFQCATRIPPTTAERLAFERNTPSRNITRSEIKFFWSRFQETIYSTKLHIWDRIMEALKMYHKILEERRAVMNEVKQLRKQQSKLQVLLRDKIAWN